MQLFVGVAWDEPIAKMSEHKFNQATSRVQSSVGGFSVQVSVSVLTINCPAYSVGVCVC